MMTVRGQPPSSRRDKSHAHDPAERGTLVRLDTVLKVAAGAAVGVAALGFPAVAAQLYRFNVPLDYFSSTQAIRAGVLPAVALLLGVALLILLTRWARAAYLAVVGASSVVGVPVFIVLAVALMVGAAAYILVVAWAIFWVLSRPLVLIVDISNRDLLYFAWVFILLFYGLAIAVRLRPQLFPRYVVLLASPFIRFREREQQQSAPVDETHKSRPNASETLIPDAGSDVKPREVESESEEVDSESDLTIWEVVGSAALAAAMAIGLAYCVKLVLYLLGFGASAEISLVRTFIGLGAVGAIVLVAGVVALLLKGLSDLEREETRQSRIRVFAAVFGVTYVAIIALYAWAIYPVLPQRFSGGKPEPVTVWLRTEDLPVGLQQSSPRVRLTVDGEWVRLEGLNLLSATSDRVILVDRTSPPSTGFVIPRESVKTLVWTSQASRSGS